MSRNWNDHKYTSAEDLWGWLDQQAQRLEVQLHDSKHFNAEGVSSLLMGRREMLDWLGDWLKDNETTLGEIAEVWGLEVKEER